MKWLQGEKEKMGSYSTVSLTPIVCKLARPVVRDAIMSHLIRTAVVFDSSVGFVIWRVCLKNFWPSYACILFFSKLSKTLDLINHLLLCFNWSAYVIQWTKGCTLFAQIFLRIRAHCQLPLLNLSLETHEVPPVTAFLGAIGQLRWQGRGTTSLTTLRLWQNRAWSSYSF